MLESTTPSTSAAIRSFVNGRVVFTEPYTYGAGHLAGGMSNNEKKIHVLLSCWPSLRRRV